jgi:hypothetical protein
MPRNLTAAEQVETLVNAVPATGEIAYDDLATAVIASGNKDALNHLFPLKRQGRLKVRTEYNPDTNKPTTFVSRA